MSTSDPIMSTGGGGLRPKVKNLNDINYNFNLLRWLVGGNIDGGNLNSDSITADHITANSIETEHIAADAITSGMITIDGSSNFGEGYDPTEKLATSDAGLLAYEDLVEEAQLGTTIISGGYIKTNLIEIDGLSSFAPGYDPTTKLATSSAGNLAYHDLVEESLLGTTIIVGGHIRTELLTADNIRTGTLSSVYIDVDTDVDIGRNLNMLSNGFGDGIFLGSTGEIFVDPSANTLVLHGNNNTQLGHNSGSTYLWGSLHGEGNLNMNNNNVSGVGTLTASHVSTSTISIGSGFTGSFTTHDGKTVQVNNGIITSVS